MSSSSFHLTGPRTSPSSLLPSASRIKLVGPVRREIKPLGRGELTCRCARITDGLLRCVGYNATAHIKRNLPVSKSHRVNKPMPTKCVISYTGGKDSTLALHHVLAHADEYEVVLLVTFVPANMTRFRAHPVHVVEVQARAMGLLHQRLEVGGSDYLAGYRRHIEWLKREWGVEVLVTGDILPVCGNFMERAVQDTGITLLRPLWNLPRTSFLPLDPNQYTALVSCANVSKFSPEFAASLVGRPFTAETMERIRAHNEERGVEVDLAGEYGEFHTMMMNAPAFRHGRVEVVRGRVVEEEEFAFYEFEEVRLVEKEEDGGDVPVA